MKLSQMIRISLITAVFLLTSYVQAKPVGITAKLMSITVKHNGKEVEIVRNQDNDNLIDSNFSRTSRPCPPFCIQPMKIAEGVETIGELEVINYAKKKSEGDESILLVDSRTSDWVAIGTIPSAINVAWSALSPKKGATTEGITKIMTKKFGVKILKDKDDFDVDESIADGDLSTVFDFSKAKTLILFCNGMWCGQSSESIKSLLKFGYPAEKIKYYRDGIQSWEILGLTMAK